MLREVFFVHLALTLIMTGVIWMVQLVHYPAFAFIAHSRSVDFCHFHTRTISFLVVPLMILELLSGGLLLYLSPTPLLVFSSASLLLIWASTFFLSVPLHTKLLTEFEPSVIQKLITTNWPRTILWSLRSLTLLAFGVLL